ncbi:hypothetical protein [Thiolapillus sp.]|uniref:hypothetical protein n=4 Tax=Thiolapillus sp. TaxID=2017437 RepID=UPI0025E7CEB1
MRILQQKIIAVLLSLLLGLLPLQGAFAAETGGHQHGALSDISMTLVNADHDRMSDMAQDCDQCEQDSCCSGSSCSVDHCVSCTLAAVLLPDTSLALPSVAAIRLAGLESQISNSTLFSLFRPPRA